MKKKLLTLDDLYVFCLKNQISHFSSQETGYNVAVQIPAQFAEMDDTDSDLLFCTVRMMHDGINRNNSKVETEKLEKAKDSVAYKPILANFVEVEEDGETVLDFGSHDLEVNEDGSITYIEKQVGAFTADAPYLVYDKKRKKNFLYATCAIPKEYTKAAEIIKRKNGTKVSVELNVSDLQFSAKDKCIVLNEFTISGCTLLGEAVGEGMESARMDIADMSEFSAEKNSAFDTKELLLEMKENFNKLISTFVDNNTDTLGKEEDNVEDESKVVEEVETTEVEMEAEEKAEVETEDVSAEFETEPSEEVSEPTESEEETSEPEEGEEASEESEEQTEVKVDEAEESVDEQEVGQKFTVSIQAGEQNFELSLDEKIYSLESLVNAQYSEQDNTWYGTTVYESYLVMHDYWNGRHFKQSYVETDGVFELTGEREEVFATYCTQAELDVLEVNKKVLEELKEYKANIEYNNEIEAKKAEMVGYESIASSAEYKELLTEENLVKLSVEELKEKADAIVGRFAMAGELKADAMVEKPHGIKLFNVSNEEKPSKYGNVFKKR